MIFLQIASWTKKNSEMNVEGYALKVINNDTN